MADRLRGSRVYTHGATPPLDCQLGEACPHPPCPTWLFVKHCKQQQQNVLWVPDWLYPIQVLGEDLLKQHPSSYLIPIQDTSRTSHTSIHPQHTFLMLKPLAAAIPLHGSGFESCCCYMPGLFHMQPPACHSPLLLTTHIW